MAEARSPNYPAIPLSLAIRHAESLWKREHRTTVPPDVAVKALGYASLSGTARVALGSLRQYGLLDKSSQGVRLSELAIRLINPADTSDRQRATQEAALSPALFKELFKHYAKASDEAIASFLITQKKFVPRGVRKCVKAFRDTVAFAGLADGGSAVTSDASASDEEGEITAHGQEPTTMNYAPDVARTTPGTGGVLFLKVPFHDGEITIRIEVSAPRITRKHIARVRKYLELVEEDSLVESEPSDIA